VLTESFRAQRDTIPMAQHTHQTAPTQFVNAARVRFAYRRFGESGGVPLVFNIHFLGTMDHWDPAVTDGFAKDREVILFDNTGISSSSGEVPTGEVVHPAAERSKRAAHSLPRRQPRLALPISRTFRPPCLDVPRGTGSRRVMTMQALKRVAQPDDIGGVEAFLASDDARWNTGDTVRVDGGSKL
jgi:hypothetical protein